MGLLERRVTDAVLHLKMNSPERLNALSDEMIAALQAEFDALHDDRSVRAVVMSGAGKVFCAGHDLKQMTAARQAEDGGRAAFKDLFDRCATMMQSVQKVPQPVIAQVHGIATAAGCQLGRILRSRGGRRGHAIRRERGEYRSLLAPPRWWRLTVPEL